MADIINFPASGEHSGRRLYLMSAESPALFSLDRSLGSPEDWLNTAMSHLKCADSGTGWNGGTIEVSKAAVSLVLMKLEELLFDGPKVSIRPED